MNASKTKVVYFFVFLCGFFAQDSSAQLGENMRFYGYFQSLGRYGNIDTNPMVAKPRKSSFYVQQINLFLFKQFDPQVSAFLNYEFVNSYASERNFGGMKIEEAWVKYSWSRRIKVKAGLLIPTFNNLNTIKNRTPMLPYLLRPLIYETTLNDVLNLNEYTPQQAYLEVYGALKLGEEGRFDYSMFVGNQAGFISDEPLVFFPSGTDTTVAKLVGGRIGVRYRGFKAGVSASADESNQSNIRGVTFDFGGIGLVDRRRLGFDLSYNGDRLFFEAEYIGVFYKKTESVKAALLEWSQSIPLLLPELNKHFYYATLGVNITDQYFLYGQYAYVEEGTNIILDAGLKGFSVGGGFRLREHVVLKAQYHATDNEAAEIFFSRSKDILMGISVFM